MLSLYGRDEWETVDMVYTDLPQSTEQILHPERYFDSDQPIEVKIPDLEASLGDTWRVIGSDVLGEFQLKMILQEYFGPLGAMEAAEGWGGDGYILLHNDSQNADVLILKTTWDDQDESDEFWDLFRTAMYHRTAYFERIDTLVGELPMRAWVGDLNSILAQQNGLDVNISIGPDIELLEIIMNAMSQ